MTIKTERLFQDGDRYMFDFSLCANAKGWAQLDTAQDAWYFGNWINPTQRKLVSYVEGDVTIHVCDTDEEFRAKVEEACTWYLDHDGKRPGIDPGFSEDLKAALEAVGLSHWMH